MLDGKLTNYKVLYLFHFL